MKVVFVSNYYNHHQSQFSTAMHELTQGNYYFVEHEPLAKERSNMGWGEKDIPDYVIQSYASPQTRSNAIDLINKADLVIFENTTRELVEQRLEKDKLTFLYSERIYKSGYQAWKLPIRYLKYNNLYRKHKNFYLLCASAYTGADFAKTRCFLNKAYKWGYFPPTKLYDLENLVSSKPLQNNDGQQNKKGWKHPSASILWVARLIGWKHPEVPIELAERLKIAGYKFELNMIGDGELNQQIEGLIHEKGLNDCVHLLGTMKPEEVRKHMEEADIFMFTSDYNEGWGAVLNESMNSGCAAVASHAIGSVPFLLKNGINGLIYKNGDNEDLFEKVISLIDSPDYCKRIGTAAYKTVTEEWNGETAAGRLLMLAEDIQKTGTSVRFKDGPCSKAGILENDWIEK